MHNDFTRRFAITVALLLGLLGLNLLPALLGHSQNRLRAQKVLAEMQNGDLNREDFDALAANYYEGCKRSRPAGPAQRE